MRKQKSAPPPKYRLTLSNEAFLAVAEQCSRAFIGDGRGIVKRNDGKWDIAISRSLLDQLHTAAFPRENLSDTVLRIMAKQKGLN